MTTHDATHKSPILLLALSALGIVFGDLGTSPLYALQEAFHGPHGISPTRENILGIVSLFLWALVLMVSIKYVALLMRAGMAITTVRSRRWRARAGVGAGSPSLAWQVSF